MVGIYRVRHVDVFTGSSPTTVREAEPMGLLSAQREIRSILSRLNFRG